MMSLIQLQKPFVNRRLHDHFYILYWCTTLMPESHSILHVSLHKVTPLHGAAEKGHFEEIVGYLVKKGTNINVEDNNGVSLHY